MTDYSPPYLKASSYLDGLLANGIKPGLQRIQILCKKLKDPQIKYPVIQIAGTNGKSSVVKMTGAILTAHGLKTGVYISPHLFTYRERISIDEADINDEDFERYVFKVKKKALETDTLTNDALTNFEVLTAIAFDYFADKEVDVAVIEAGMGGRYDATSLSNPSVSVITSIDLDHTDILGETIGDIAMEKASIISKNAKTVAGKTNLEAQEVVRKRADEVRSKLYEEEEQYYIVSSTRLINGYYKAKVKGIFDEYESLKCPFAGKHQLSNMAMAIAVSELFINGKLKKPLVEKALASVKLPARMQLIRKNPKVVIDVSHNPAGVKEFLNTITSDYDYERLLVVTAVFTDKDYKTIVQLLDETADILYVTRNNNSRSAKAKDLIKVASGKGVQKKLSVKSALEEALKVAGRGDLIGVTGSFATACEAVDLLNAKFNDNN